MLSVQRSSSHLAEHAAAATISGARCGGRTISHEVAGGRLAGPDHDGHLVSRNVGWESVAAGRPGYRVAQNWRSWPDLHFSRYFHNRRPADCVGRAAPHFPMVRVMAALA